MTQVLAESLGYKAISWQISRAKKITVRSNIGVSHPNCGRIGPLIQRITYRPAGGLRIDQQQRDVESNHANYTAAIL